MINTWIPEPRWCSGQARSGNPLFFGWCYLRSNRSGKLGHPRVYPGVVVNFSYPRIYSGSSINAWKKAAHKIVPASFTNRRR